MAAVGDSGHRERRPDATVENVKRARVGQRAPGRAGEAFVRRLSEVLRRGPAPSR
ncbi:hypothetical protein H7X46_12670 [Pseudonocardia sp. C8]|uniref:hypothetical protein n=1 Tax=Pseudonocardia sp. C8 TaxID=2762759 RepID=UPI001642ED04|nr:hypothetical protein [Pseudonocardia sp. C8]MBC3191917.1 hypothetical protein [Pseudonocardia sp. C8]